jgi:Holliday junction resolvasome RuvABC endonuclease subunit
MNLILGIDPGLYIAGYSVVDTDTWHVQEHGKTDWSYIRNILRSLSITGVALESIVVYIHTRKGGMDIKPITGICEHIGRIKQICDDKDIECKTFTRAQIIEGLTGQPPTRKNRVSKAHMQTVVQEILNLEKVIRPQDANDSVCAILAGYHQDYCYDQGN